MLMSIISILLGLLNLWYSSINDIGLLGYRVRINHYKKQIKQSNQFMAYLFFLDGVILFLLTMFYHLSFFPSFIIWILLLMLTIAFVEGFLYLRIRMK